MLTGIEPAQFSLAEVINYQASVPEASVGLPSVLLERRPDIAEQQRLVAAANEQIGIARTAYYPSFTLSAEAGLQGTTLWNWMNWPSRFWAIGGQLTQTLYDGGRRKANTALAQEQYDGAVSNYRQTALQAFREVEDELASLRALQTEHERQLSATQDARERLDISKVRLDAGMNTRMNLLAANLQVYADQLNVIEIEKRQLQSTVVLVKATGGGWSANKLSAIR